MEQPNAMQSGMHPQNMNGMQRPQPGNPSQQIHAQIMNSLRNNMQNLPQGWQQTFDLGQRASRILQMFSQLRLLPRVHPIPQCFQIATSFEQKTIMESQTKEMYLATMDAKLADVANKRRMQSNGGLQPTNMSMNENGNNAGMPNVNMGGMGPMGGAMAGMNIPNMTNMPNVSNMANMANMPNMPNMNMMQTTGMMQNTQAMNNGGGHQGQGFPAHLQRPMQASPLPPQQQQANSTMDPSALQNNQMPPQMSNMNLSGTPQPRNVNMNMNMNVFQAEQGAPTHQEIVENMQKLLAQISDDRKIALRNQFLSSMSEQQRAHITSQPGDPLMRFLYQKSKDMLRQKAAQMGLQPKQNGGNVQMNNNPGMPANNLQRPQSSQPGNQKFDFSSIVGQQENALKSQESGEQVVPASNHSNLNFGGRIGLPQGTNPQMSGTQNIQSDGNQQMMFMNMQQKQKPEAFERNQAAHQAAQQQAMRQAQSNQLRGLPGGLNGPNALNGGQVNSPAMNMSMLNRPMVPPGQPTPAPPTPQQNRPQGPSQMPAPPNGANQFAQYFQGSQNPNQQGNQGSQKMTPGQEMVLHSLPENLREKITSLPPDQVAHVLARFSAQRNQNQASNNQRAGMPQNMNMTGPQMANQLRMMSGVPPSMGGAAPGFNSAQPPNQQLSQPPDPAAQLQQRLAQHQNSQLRQRAMDMRPFPKTILGNINLSVPQNVQEWGTLKQHIMHNQSVLPPGLLDKLQNIQHQWFETHPEEMNAATQALQRQLQSAQSSQQAQQQSLKPGTAQMMNGQAPQAQMVPANVPMQQPPNMAPNMAPNTAGARPPFPTPTMQEVQMLREKVPQAQHMTDDDIKALILRRKINAMNSQSMQQNQLLKTTQRAQVGVGGGQSASMSNANQSQNQQQPSRPLPQQSMNRVAPAQVQQGQKRPQSSSDDPIEIANPLVQQQSAPQAPHMQPSQSHPGQPLVSKFSSQEDPSKLAQQRKVSMQTQQRLEALRKAQLGFPTNQQQQPLPSPNRQQPQTAAPMLPQGPLNEQERERLRNLYQEVIRTNPKGPPVQVDADGLALAQSILRKLWPAMVNIDKTFPTALRSPIFGDQRLKNAVRAKLIVQQNAADDKGNIKDHLAVTPIELRKVEAFVAAYFTELKAIKERGDTAAKEQMQSMMNNAQAQQPQTRPQSSTMAKQQAQPLQAPQPPQPPQAQPMGRTDSQASHGRKGASNQKAPPAPIENKSFDWGTLSPHGIPIYEHNRNELTTDKLKMPQPKRQRRGGAQSGSPASTHAQQAAVPGAVGKSPATVGTKAPSAEQLKKAQLQMKQDAEQKQAEKHKFRCSDMLCQASVQGFDTEAQLKEHLDADHKPVEDPATFLLDNAATALKVDKNGVPLSLEKVAKAPTEAVPKPQTAVVTSAAASAVAAAGKKGNQTPRLRQENAATAASPAAGSTKTNATPASKQAAGTKAPDSAAVPAGKEHTLLDALAEKMGFEMASATDTKDAELPGLVINDADWFDINQTNMSGLGNLVDEWAEFRDAQDGGLGVPQELSPSLTPSSGASQSSHESDVSPADRLFINLKWDAFGNGDTGVPEGLMETLGLGVEDAIMVDASEGTKGNEAVEKKTQEGESWNWTADLASWDAMFGANAGLENDAMNWNSMGMGM